MPSPTGFSQFALASLSGDPVVDPLIGGTRWAGSTVSYSFPGVSAAFDPDYPEPDFTAQVTGLNTVQQTAAVSALTAWTGVADLEPVRVSDTASSVGDLRIAFAAGYDWSDSVGQAYFPSAGPAAGDVWLDPAGLDIVNARGASTFRFSSFAPGSFAYYVLLHELGHALGLKHPFSAGERNPTVIDPAYDSNLYTLMSYTVLTDHPDALGYTYWPTTPMLLDVAALQAIYGANAGAQSGDTTYRFNDNFGQTFFQTIWDSGGSNAIAYSGSTPAMIDLHEGAGSRIGNGVYAYTATTTRAYAIDNVWIAYGTRIDTATVEGTGAATLVGNDHGNVLSGGAGNDTITGGSGRDVLVGNGGDDVLEGGAGVDQANYAEAQAAYAVAKSATGTTVRSLSGSEGLDTLSEVERLHFSDRGIAFDGDGTAGQAFRLYQAAFDRMPDLAGLGYWIAQLDSGTPLGSVAEFFHHSAEFAALYGTAPTNSEFVTLMYRNVLHRAPDQSGFDYWMEQLAADNIDGTGLLMFFSESPENHTQTASAVQNGIEYLFYSG